MPVIINPNVPIGLEDFRTLYTGNGMSPDQNAAQLALTAPQGARGYIQDQWRRTGIPQSPEQYFSNPYPAGMPGFQSNNQPLYHNEGQRNMAIALGQNHPFESPDNRMAALAQHLQGVPHPLDDPQLKQIMGEDPKRGQYIYAALTGGRNYEEDAKTAEERTYRQGQITDTRTYEEQKSTERDAQTENTYQQHQAELDAKQRAAAIAVQQYQPIKDAKENLLKLFHERNATIDPNTGKLQAMVQIPGTNDGTVGSDRPREVMQNVNPETQNDYEKYYSDVFGVAKPQPFTPSPAMQLEEASQLKNLSPEQKAYYDQQTQAFVAHTAQTPNAAERIKLLRQTYDQINPQNSLMGRLKDVAGGFGNTVAGMKWDTTPEQAAAILGVNQQGAMPIPQQVQDNQLNWWGKFLRSQSANQASPYGQ